MTIIDPFKIETNLHTIIAQYRAAWDRLAPIRDDYTPEGLAKSFATSTASTTAKLNAARAELEDYAAGIDMVIPAERARVLPPAPTGGYTSTQELAAARILGRHVDWDISTYVAAVEPMAGTPTATLITEELAARNRLADGAEDVLLHTVSERYAAATKLVQLMMTGLNGPLMSLVREAERAANVETWFSNHSEPGRHLVSLSDAHGPLRLDTSNGYVASDDLPPLTKKS
ncbi:MAG: hypothetical protein GX859_02285 [Corynebacterium humireducens]|uniref:Uncharacterized protein n=1 Tax=Corynebacterium humireducens TaxID=1223514 RepID=A0A7X6PLE6_9CORY|nr:hypothetical protein [Corynebacterium humireducens]